MPSERAYEEAEEREERARAAQANKETGRYGKRFKSKILSMGDREAGLLANDLRDLLDEIMSTQQTAKVHRRASHMRMHVWPL